MKQESDRQIAERLSGELGFTVTRGCLRYWRQRGFDLSDSERLQKQLRNLQRVRPGAKRITAPADSIPAPVARTIAELESQLISAPDFETARTISTKLAGLKNAHRLRAQMAEYVTRESVERDAQLVEKVFRRILETMARTLPGLVIGLEYADASKRCQDYCYDLLVAVSTESTYAATSENAFT
jgi:hypothetical protein